MSNIVSETTETGGKVVVPITAVINGDVQVSDLIREKIKEEGEKVGKTKVRLSETYDAGRESYIVEWTWV